MIIVRNSVFSCCFLGFSDERLTKTDPVQMRLICLAVILVCNSDSPVVGLTKKVADRFLALLDRFSLAYSTKVPMEAI